nr:retrovirus-related Pol polyprotein from transposon TNT 1-94 [Tanacetum cinerariifolium]
MYCVNQTVKLVQEQCVDTIDHGGTEVEEKEDFDKVQVVSFYTKTDLVEPLEWKSLENRLKPSSVKPPKLELKELPKHLENMMDENGVVINKKQGYMGFVVYQIDVKSAFLNGKLSKEVYVQQPLGLKAENFSTMCASWIKDLYGLKQAPEHALGWHLEEITGQDCNFTRRGSKNCLQCMETASGSLATPLGFSSDGIRIFETAS